MTEMTREEALAHFGVAGMKWGVRNARPSGASTPTTTTAKKKKPSSADIKEASQRHNARIARGNQVLNAVSPLSSKTQKQKAIDELKRIANDPSAKKDMVMATTATKGDHALGILVAGPLGPMLVNSNMKAQRKYADAVLEAWGSATIDKL